MHSLYLIGLSTNCLAVKECHVYLIKNVVNQCSIHTKVWLLVCVSASWVDIVTTCLFRRRDNVLFEMFLKICLLYAVLLVCDNNTRRRCIRITYVLEKNNNPANKANLHRAPFTSNWTCVEVYMRILFPLFCLLLIDTIDVHVNIP